MPSLEDLLSMLLPSVKEVGQLVMAESARKVTEKGKSDLVTEADRKCERFLREVLGKICPEDGVVGEEEEGPQGFEKKRVWYIDPIDGTTNFAHGLPLFCISLGLVERDGSKEQPLLGVVYAPAMDCLYFGGAGLGAYCETKGSRKRLEVSSVSTIERALLASGFPSAELRRKMALGEKEPWAASQKERLWRLDAMGHGVRRLGVAALEICWVAEGRFDAFWDFGLRPWDVAGATAILNEAGGKATDVDGGELDLHSARYLASNGKLHSALVEAMREGLDEGVPLLSKEA